MRRVKKAMKRIALALSVMMAATSVPGYVHAEPAENVAITADDFLKAEGKNLVNQNGDVVNLRGTNAGGYLIQEFWCTPTAYTDNCSAEDDIFSVLTERFGKQAMYEIVDVYQDAYWTEADFDNCAELGMNVIRLPFWWRNLVDENGIFYGEYPFGDIAESKWYYQAAKFAYDNGLIAGKGKTEDGLLKFAPSENMTRAQFVQVLYAKENKPAVEFKNTFTDVKETDWFADAIIWANENGIVKGTGETFNVKGNISREQMVAILYKYAQYKEYTLEGEADLSGFTDAATISSYAVPAMKWAVNAGAISGTGEAINPKGKATRAQAVTILQKFIEATEGTSEEDTPDVVTASDTEDPYAEAFERIDWFVEEAGERGLYVILDFHGAPGSQNGSDHSGADGGDQKEAESYFFFGDKAEANQELYYEMWEVIAERYAGNPVVAGYDLLNEPYCTYRYNSKLNADELHDLLWNIYDKAYDVIRAVDPDHVIIMEATWDPVDLPNPVQYGWENIMYEYHNYLYDDYDNAAGRQITNMETKVNAIGNADYNVPSYLGEFCYFNNLDAWDEGLALLTNAGLNWTTWTYKTTADYGNWGHFHHPEEFNNRINLETASKEQILSWYSRMGENIEENAGLTEITSKWYQEAAVANTLGPKYAEVKDGDYYLVGNNTMKVLTSAVDGDLVAATDEPEDMGDEANQLFKLVNNTDGTVSLKASNGKYISVSTTDNKMYATATEIADTEKFYMLEVSPTTVAFKSVETETFVTVVNPELEEGEEAPATLEVFVQAYSITGDESFQLYDTDINLVGAPKLATYSGWSRFEAEDEEVATIYGDGAVESSVAAYSGGFAVGALNSGTALADVAADWSNINYVEFTVEAPADGEYMLSLNYNGNDNKDILVKVNDGEQEVISLPSVAGGSWDTLFEHIIAVDLVEGENTIAISGTINNKGWMNIDCVDVINAPLGTNDVYARYEAENYYTNATVNAQGHFSGGKGVENCNSDVAVEDVAFNWANIKYVDFTIYAEEAGEYDVVLGYTGSNATGMTVLTRVNRGDDQALTIDNEGGDWNKPRTHAFKVNLDKGFNVLKLSGTLITTAHYANIDYIDVKPVAVAETPKEIAAVVSGFNHYEVLNTTIVGGEETEDETATLGNVITGLDNADVAVGDVAADWSNINYVKYVVAAPRAGEYRMLVAYDAENAATGLVKVNDGEAVEVAMPATTGYGYKVVEVTLAEGENTILVSGAIGEGSYNIDYMELSRAEIFMTDEDTERYEAEYYSYQSNKPDAEVVEGQPFYSGPDGTGIGGLGTPADYELGQNLVGSGLSYVNFTVFTEAEGEYKITVRCNGNGADMVAVYQANDDASANYDILNDGGAWDTVCNAEFTVNLEKGMNQLIISGPYDGWSSWLNMDCIDVTAVTE